MHLPNRAAHVRPGRATRRRRLIALTICVALAPAACSDDSPQAEGLLATLPPTTTTTTTIAPATTTTTAPATTTTEVAEGTTTTTIVVVPSWPLTGVPLPDGVDASRSAMVVKLDNHPKSRPQTGLNEADIVFEENVEQLTRFAAVFHSNGSDPVGPIRSGRTQDIDLLGSLNRPLFVWSGGNRRVTEAIFASDLRQISPSVAAGPFFRTSRDNPHDLYSNVSELFALAPPDATAPAAQFEYRTADDAPTGDRIAAAKISMDGVRVMWRWDRTLEKFLRFTDDAVHKDTVFDAQVSTENVIVLYVAYRPSPADGRSPEAQTIGSGEVMVYSAGHLVTGTWTRPDRLSPFLLADASGAPILLTPGRTFVELARVGTAATVPDGADVGSVPYP